MISTQGLWALRVAATLTHSVPRLRARVRVGSTVLVDVGAESHDEPTQPWAGTVMSPCAFRMAVAEAYDEQQAGRNPAFLLLPAGTDPTIDIGTPRDGASLPGGLYKVPFEGRWLWAFATTLDAKTAFDLGRPLVADALGSLRVAALGLRPDPVTGVSLAYAESHGAVDRSTEASLIDLLHGLMARWTAHELLASIEDGTHDRNSL